MRAELGCINAQKVALLRQKLNDLKKDLPHRGSHIFASENCDGDNIYNSKNCHNCFDITHCEDCKYVEFTPKGLTTQDACFTAPEGLEQSYFVCSSLGGQRMLFDFLAYYCSDTYYTMECHHCNHLFGCASLRHKNHCIFNKEYSKEEYEKLAGRIVEHMIETGEWGEYFPTAIAPICYNESNAQDYFPITKEFAQQKSWTWRDEDVVQESGEKLLDVPDNINVVDDSICDRVLICEGSGKQYKIVPQELKFYKDMNIALPRKNAVARHQDRLKLRCPRKVWWRTCANCGESHWTNYKPDRPEKVYCEKCYLETVY